MRCPVCHTSMPGDSGDGVCPRCALHQALQAAPAAGGSAGLDSYERLHELGRGAMGVVWLARERGLDRLVALKVIAASDDSLQAQRLLREGQAAARLSHPNIVAIHALGGSGADTFLAMDFAEGGNLAERVNGEPLAPPAAALVLAKLAGAVAHAHAKGILHRDIKPSNVLLSASGEPQLADFGLAGAVEGRGDLTRTGQVVGTPAYLAPELLASAAAASPAADVYALGAVLYFCLTARPPFVGNSTAALLHQVAEADPIPPRLLQPGVPRDLETICLKCLSKSPARRYALADDLRADLERFLRHEPIAARPLGRWGKTLRWTRRHPNKAAGLALAATLVLLLAIGGPLVALRLAHDRRVAEQAAAEAKAINEFLRNDLLGQVSSVTQFLPDTKLMTVIDRAAPQIDRRFADQPTIRAALHEQIGNAYLSLGAYPVARTHLAEAYRLRLQLHGLDDPATLRVRTILASIYIWLPNFALMERVERDTWERQKRLLGPEHPDTLISQEAVATALRYLGRYREAEPVAAPLLPVRRRVSGPDSWEYFSVMNNLGIIYSEEGKYADAELIIKPALEGFRRNFGEDNLGTLRTANLLAVLYTRLGRMPESVALGREVVERYQRVYGPDNPQTLQVMINLTVSLVYLAQFEEARPLCEKVLAARTRVSGADNPETLVVMVTLANILRNLHQYDEAERLAKAGVAGFERALGPNHPFTTIAQFALAGIYKFSDRPTEAEPIMRDVLARRQKILGPAHTETLLAETEVGDILLREHRFAEAEVPLRETIVLAEKGSWEAWKLSLTRSRLGEALLSQGKLADAEPLLLAGAKGLSESRATMPVYLQFEIAQARDRLVRLYTARDQPAEAEKWRSAP